MAYPYLHLVLRLFKPLFFYARQRKGGHIFNGLYLAALVCKGSPTAYNRRAGVKLIVGHSFKTCALIKCHKLKLSAMVIVHITEILELHSPAWSGHNIFVAVTLVRTVDTARLYLYRSESFQPHV